MFAGAANAGAPAIVGFGMIRPAFDVSVELDLPTFLYAAGSSIALWSVAAYIHSRTEDER